jgi:glycosyltransferase involved in cell wall biosynthesis
MKLLVFAHTPPPHHGQSLMVQTLVEGFRSQSAGNSSPSPARSSNEYGIEIFHVNARLSDGIEDVGTARIGKIFGLLKYCAQAIRLRFRHGVRTMYYVPAPAKRAPLYRDWLVMGLCRPFFRSLIFHWHAVGLGEWIETSARPWERWLTRRLLGRAALALALSEFNRADAEKLQPRRTAIVANGIPDPCPTCEYELLPWRSLRRQTIAQAAATQRNDTTALVVARVIFIAHCTRDKGLFDAIEAVARANANLATRRVALRLELRVAGEFLSDAERSEFERLRVANADWLTYVGFVRGDAKEAFFRTADVLLFPTYYANEGQPVALIEAMAFALPVVTTRWRAIPEALPPNYAGLLEPRQPEHAAEAVLRALTEDSQPLREQFIRRFSIQTHLAALAKAIRSIENPPSNP